MFDEKLPFDFRLAVSKVLTSCGTVALYGPFLFSYFFGGP
jgi:hypothetical protein